jgi:hypothetical protein
MSSPRLLWVSYAQVCRRLGERDGIAVVDIDGESMNRKPRALLTRKLCTARRTNPQRSTRQHLQNYTESTRSCFGQHARARQRMAGSCWFDESRRSGEKSFENISLNEMGDDLL